MLDDVLSALKKDEEKKQTRIKRIPKPITLGEDLDRLSMLKWNADIEIFNTVRVALLAGKVARPTMSRMKKDDILTLWIEMEKRRREEMKQYVRDSKPDNYFIVQDLKTWLWIQKKLYQENLAGWDTETNGLNFMSNRIVGMSAYLPKSDIAFYTPFGHTTGEQQLSEDQILIPIKDWLEDPSNLSVWHNYKFDGHMLSNHDIEVANPYWDTMVGGRLLNEHEDNHKLKPLYDKYCGKEGEKSAQFEDLIDAADIAGTDVLLAGVYACGDPYKTFKLFEFQKPHIDSVGNLKTVWYQIEQQLMPVDVRIERQGLRINVDKLKSIEEEQLPKIAQAEQDLRTSFKIDDDFIAAMSTKINKVIPEFNFSSNDHLAYLIYDVLNVGTDMPKKFGKKERSTAGEVIDAIIENVPELSPLLDYRELSKLVNTYAHKIPLALENDGRLHSQFDSYRTATGRYASSEYGNKNDRRGTNLQNIPSRTELGIEVRKCIIPDEDEIFVSSDLSQIEPRQIANLLYLWCGDSSMRNLYIDNKDLYTNMAMKVFGLPEECCVDKAYNPEHTFKPRSLMKTGVLAYLYGQSAKSFAKKMSVDQEIAEMFFTGMETEFPGLKPFREKVLEHLRKYGFVETLYGRKRRFPNYQKQYARLQTLNKKPWKTLSDAESEERNDLWKKCAKAEREAVNTVIQGTSADILKQIIIAMDKLCRTHGWRLMMSIHDEILMSVKKASVTMKTIELINQTMTQTATCSVPLKCDTVIQPRWMEEYSPSNWDFENCCPIAVKEG